MSTRSASITLVVGLSTSAAMAQQNNGLWSVYEQALKGAAALGKLEAEVAIETLMRRYARLRLVEGQRLSFHPNISFRGPRALWVRATP